MQELIASLSPQEEIDIENQLKKLFTLADKPMREGQLDIFLQEIVSCGKPYHAILSGIDSLKDWNAKRLRLCDILDAIRSRYEPSSSQDIFCDQCHNRGLVVTKDVNGYNFGIACSCQNGNRFRA